MNHHLLIIRFSAIGDVAMTVPIVLSLARQYPDMHITMLSRPFARSFFENLAPNISFMGADLKKEYHGIHGLNLLYRRLAAKNFTAVADFHHVLRSNFLCLRFFMNGVKVRQIDKHRSGKRKLTRVKHKVKIQQPTSFDNYAEVLTKLGFPITYDFTSIYPQGSGNLRLIADRIGNKLQHQAWIGFAPFAAHRGKMYDFGRMKEVINIVINRHPSCRIFLFGGGQKEMERLNEVAASHEHITNASALLKGFSEELILMSHLNVMVSMDSGNMHLASLVGTPVVSIWGATHPYAGFMGWNQPQENAVQVDLSCRPCSIYGNKPCMRHDYACLETIDAKEVVEKIEAVLS